MAVLIVSREGVVFVSEMKSVARWEESERLTTPDYTVDVLVRVFVHC